MTQRTVGAATRTALVVFAGTLCFAAAATAQVAQIEAEAYTDAFNVGGFDIVPTYCSVASNKEVVTGLDLSGEWIEVDVTIPAAGCYEAVVAFRATWSSENSVNVTLAGAGADGGDVVTKYSFVGAGTS